MLRSSKENPNNLNENFSTQEKEDENKSGSDSYLHQEEDENKSGIDPYVDLHKHIPDETNDTQTLEPLPLVHVEKQHELGKGSYGIVYKARVKGNGDDYIRAVKYSLKKKFIKEIQIVNDLTKKLTGEKGWNINLSQGCVDQDGKLIIISAIALGGEPKNFFLDLYQGGGFLIISQSMFLNF